MKPGDSVRLNAEQVSALYTLVEDRELRGVLIEAQDPDGLVVHFTVPGQLPGDTPHDQPAERPVAHRLTNEGELLPLAGEEA